MDVPEEYGGLGADFLYSVIITEEMARTNQSGLCTALHSDVVVPYITEFGSEELKKKYLPGCVSGDIIAAVAMTEPNTGSDLAAIRPRRWKMGMMSLSTDRRHSSVTVLTADSVLLQPGIQRWTVRTALSISTLLKKVPPGF